LPDRFVCRKGELGKAAESFGALAGIDVKEEVDNEEEGDGSMITIISIDPGVMIAGIGDWGSWDV
jgi:hypothetical protein